MKTRTGLAALLLAAFVLPVRADDKPKLDDKKMAPAVVPFELLDSGHMTVMVKVNGKGPYKLIFDTGAPITLINNKVAKEADLLKGIKKPPISLFGTMGEATIKELEVGGQKAEDVAAVVMDHPTVEAISKAFGPIEGIVGYPFFARYRMTLDYKAKTMTLVPNGFKPPNVMESLQRDLMAMMMSKDKQETILSSASQWGLVVDKKDGDEEAGVTVGKVRPGSAAAKAGLKDGDRLLTIDGRWTDSVADTFSAANAVKPGTKVAVEVLRGGKKTTLQVQPTAGL